MKLSTNNENKDVSAYELRASTMKQVWKTQTPRVLEKWQGYFHVNATETIINKLPCYDSTNYPSIQQE